MTIPFHQWMKKLYVLVGTVLLAKVVYSQQTILKVLDSRSNDPVPFANVCFESLDTQKLNYSITDKDGFVSYNLVEESVISVSFVGYNTHLDTIKPGITKEIYLEPAILGLDEVVVTAQFKPKLADQSIYKIQVINQDMIRAKGVSNLGEALSNELTMRINHDAALGSSISLQGLTGEHVKILLDGVPVIGRLNGNIDLNQLNLENADHIEIVEGPMSVIYGSNALAGAINVITKEHTRSGISAQGNSYWESVGIYNFNASTGITKGVHYFFISGTRNFFGGYSEIDSGRTSRWKPRLQYDLDANYTWKRNRFNLKLNSKLFDETIQSKGPVQPLPPSYAKAFDAYFYTTRWISGASFEFNPNETNLISGISSFTLYKRIKNTFTKDLTTLDEVLNPDQELHDTTIFKAYLIRATWSNDDPSSAFGFQSGMDINIETSYGKRILYTNQSIGDYAVYFNLHYRPFSQLLFQPGIRYGYNSHFNYPLVASVNMKWDVIPVINWRLSYAHGFRAPSLKELFLYFVDINHNIQGNPNLRAEYSNNIQSNWIYSRRDTKSSLVIEAGMFYNQVRNSISLAIDSNGVYSYVNIDEFNTLGGTIRFQYQLHPRLTARLGFSETGRWSDLHGNEKGILAYNWSPETTAGFDCRWIKQGLSVSLLYKYTGKLPQFYLNDDNLLEEGYIDSYHTLNVSTTKDFFKKRLTLTIGGKNLFNYTSIYATVVSTGAHTSGGNSIPVGWGRTFFVKLTYKFNKMK